MPSTFLACVATLVAVAMPSALATPNYQNNVPNGAQVRVGSAACGGFGHTSCGGGGTRNSFGTAFQAAGYSWTNGLCNADSDGDGVSNGQELGDPSCVWTSGATPARTTQISNPGDAASTPSNTPIPPTPTPTATPTATSTTTPTGTITPTATTTTTATTTPTATAGVTPTSTTTLSNTTSTTTTTTTSTSTSTTQLIFPTSENAVSDGSGQIRLLNSTRDVPLLRTEPVEIGLGSAKLSWAVYPAATSARRQALSIANTDIIEMTVSWSTDGYLGVGTADSAMSGPLVCCFVNGQTGAGICRQMVGQNTDAVLAGTQTVAVVNASLLGSDRTVTFRLRAGDLKIASASQRFIFARGAWSPLGGGVPLQHGGADRTARSINIAAGTAVTPLGADNGFYAMVLVMAGTVALGIAAISFGFARANAPSRPGQGTAAASVTLLLAVGLWAGGAALWGTYATFRGSSLTTAVARTFGFSTAAGFWFLLWPMTRSVGLARFVHSSFERTLPYHALFGTIVWATMTIHFIMMLTLVRLEVIGLLAWIASTLQVLGAIFLRPFFYSWFRAMHFLLFATVIVLGCIHSQTMLIFVSAPVALYLVDQAYRFILEHRGRATVLAASYDAASTATKVVLRFDDGSSFLGERLIAPGEFIFLRVPTASAIFRHPLSVAHVAATSRDVTLFVKAGKAGTWTNAVAQSAAASQLDGTRASAQGPYGVLQVPINTSHHILVIAGGIGATASLSILQAATRGASSGAPAPSHPSVRFIWVVRDPALPRFMWSTLEQCCTGNNAKDVQMTLCVTGPPTTEKEMETIRGVSLALIRGRFDWTSLFGPYSRHDAVAVYTCGPEAMMEAVAAACHARGGETFLHQETFSF